MTLSPVTKLLVAAIVLAAVASGQADTTSPRPLVPPSPISEPALVAASGTARPYAVSNGEITLVVWDDPRNGLDEIIGTRVNARGEALDPLGIALSRGSVAGVFWNGARFGVVASHREGNALITFVSRDGVVEERREVPVAGELAAITTGPDPRLLFARRFNAPPVRTAYSVVDGEARVVAGEVLLPIPDKLYGDHRIIAGGNSSEFLLIRYQRWPGEVYRWLVDRISRNGALLSTVETGDRRLLSHSSQLVAADNGWILITSATDAQNGARFVIRFLDESGATTGRTVSIGAPNSEERARIFRDGGRHLITWSGQTSATTSLSFITELRSDGTLSNNHLVGTTIATPGTAAIVDNGGTKLVIFGSRVPRGGYHAATLPETLEHDVPSPLAFHDSIERNIQLTGSDHGFLASWQGVDPDKPGPTYLRRLSKSGFPQGDVEVIDDARPDSVRMTSNGDVYLVAWRASASAMIRRMDASTGRWLDAAPFNFGTPYEFALGSNGNSAIAVVVELCGREGGGCVTSYSIPMSGPILGLLPVRLTTVAGWVQQLSVASDGSDYLVLWSEGYRGLLQHLPFLPFTLQLSRLRGDGSPIDTTPFTLISSLHPSYPEHPNAAWDGTKYVVVWREVAIAGAQTVKAARVSADLSVSEAGPDGRGTVIATLDLGWPAIPSGPLAIMAHGDRMTAIVEKSLPGSLDPDSRWLLISFDRRAPLGQVGPPELLLDGSGTFFSSLRAATSQNTLMIAFTTLANGEHGHVSRAFAQPFGRMIQRRRSVAR